LVTEPERTERGGVAEVVGSSLQKGFAGGSQPNKARRKAELSCASSNHYLTAIKNFLHWAEMLRVDLKSAKIQEKTEEGVVDFHALRVTYITNLARSDIHPKTAQILARHGDVQLTVRVCTKLGKSEVADAPRVMPPAHHLAHHKRD